MNKNKILKTIFIFLIILSLTTTFVVSASATEASDTPYVRLHYSLDGGEYVEFYSAPIQHIGVNSSLAFRILFFLNDVIFDDVNYKHYSLFELCDYADQGYAGSDVLLPINFISFYTSLDPTIQYFEFFSGSDEGIDLLYSFGFLVPSLSSYPPFLDIYFQCESVDPSISFTDSVSSGLTSSLGWVGQLVDGLTDGPIKPLLGCFAVTISVSAVLLGIYSIKRFIWGK